MELLKETFPEYLDREKYKEFLRGYTPVSSELVDQIREETLDNDYSGLDELVRQSYPDLKSRDDQEFMRIFLKQAILMGDQRRKLGKRSEAMHYLDVAFILEYFAKDVERLGLDTRAAALLHDFIEDKDYDTNILTRALEEELERSTIRNKGQYRHLIPRIVTTVDMLTDKKKVESRILEREEEFDYHALARQIFGRQNGVDPELQRKAQLIKLADRIAQKYEMDEKPYLSRLQELFHRTKHRYFLGLFTPETIERYQRHPETLYRKAVVCIGKVLEEAAFDGMFYLRSTTKDFYIYRKCIERMCEDRKYDKTMYDQVMVNMKNALVLLSIENGTKKRLDHLLDDNHVSIEAAQAIDEKLKDLKLRGYLDSLTSEHPLLSTLLLKDLTSEGRRKIEERIKDVLIDKKEQYFICKALHMRLEMDLESAFIDPETKKVNTKDLHTFSWEERALK